MVTNLLVTSSCYPNSITEREHRLISANRQFERGLDTYATKKYGDDWQDYHDYAEIAEEFEEWREDAY